MIPFFIHKYITIFIYIKSLFVKKNYSLEHGNNQEKWSNRRI